MKSTFRNVLLFIVILFAFTACGGGSSSSGTDTEKQEIAIKKISDYASDWQSHAQPTQDDYIAAGVENISAIDVDDLNAIVRDSEAEEVDTVEELNTLVRTLMDTIEPVITLNGNSSISITIGNVYIEKGATALDNKDGDISSKIVTVNTVDTSKEGSYTVTYSVEDEAGNSTEKIRTVNVVIQLDETAPILTLNGAAEINILRGKAYSDAGATALDDRDGDISSNIVTVGSVDTSKVGTYTITYSVKDIAGNEAEVLSRTVYVVLSSVGKLLEEAANGTNNNVKYVVVGDSTRNYPYEFYNTILVEHYYPEQLANINVSFVKNAYSGMEAKKWLQNILDYNNDGSVDDIENRKYTLSDTLNQIPVLEDSNYIVEFSLGINDTKDISDKESLKTTIHNCITTLHQERPNLKVLMVSPVKFDLHAADPTYNPTVLSTDLEAIYQEVYDELSINLGVDSYLTLVSGRKATENIFDNYHDEYYGDWVHPNEEGSKILFNYIFEHVTSLSTYNSIKL